MNNETRKNFLLHPTSIMKIRIFYKELNAKTGKIEERFDEH